MPTPTLIVVSGPTGSGKTQLAHALAPLIPCPAVCRDEIKEGMVHAAGPGFVAAAGDPLTVRTLDAFFDVVRVLVEAEVSLVVEAAFQDRIWRHGLEPLLERVELRIVQCEVDVAVAWERARQRLAARPAHAVGGHVHDLDAWTDVYGTFERISFDAPSLSVDTTDGYAPGLPQVVAFVGD
ncbi:MAG TPA: AAA family ATPase [Gaiella sp.]